MKWKKMSNISGYQIQYSKAFGSKKTVKVSSKLVSKILSNLTSGSTYAVRVRAYATTNGKTAYGNWSTAKEVKVK
ncbi:MAG: fibronectin type III domain-containing protein [Clostridiales bacterium]|nr:fibronectin type III domain-containing protein [Clostridiales bacterium]